MQVTSFVWRFVATVCALFAAFTLWASSAQAEVPPGHVRSVVWARNVPTGYEMFEVGAGVTRHDFQRTRHGREYAINYKRSLPWEDLRRDNPKPVNAPDAFVEVCCRATGLCEVRPHNECRDNELSELAFKAGFSGRFKLRMSPEPPPPPAADEHPVDQKVVHAAVHAGIESIRSQATRTARVMAGYGQQRRDRTIDELRNQRAWVFATLTAIVITGTLLFLFRRRIPGGQDEIDLDSLDDAALEALVDNDPRIQRLLSERSARAALAAVEKAHMDRAPAETAQRAQLPSVSDEIVPAGPSSLPPPQPRSVRQAEAAATGTDGSRTSVQGSGVVSRSSGGSGTRPAVPVSVTRYLSPPQGVPAAVPVARANGFSKPVHPPREDVNQEFERLRAATPHITLPSTRDEAAAPLPRLPSHGDENVISGLLEQLLDEAAQANAEDPPGHSS